MRKSLLACILLLCPAVFAATVHWEYSGEAGPAQWARLTPEFGQCAGSNQSPVNLTALVEAELAPLQFHYQAGGKTLVNNGHTVQVNYAPGSTLQLDGMAFELKQFHFHAPSENLIEGKSYPLEGHLVHANGKGELAVVAVMFEAGRANAALSQAWQALPTKVGETRALKAPLSAELLLPARRDYYRFSGSPLQRLADHTALLGRGALAGDEAAGAGESGPGRRLQGSDAPPQQQTRPAPQRAAGAAIRFYFTDLRNKKRANRPSFVFIASLFTGWRRYAPPARRCSAPAGY